MIHNYIKIAIRNILKDKYSAVLYFFILTIGIASSVFIFRIVSSELSFDKFHKNPELIYRITTHINRKGTDIRWAITNGYLATMLEEQIPEVDVATKFQVVQSNLTVHTEDNTFILPERNGFFTDADFFDVFDFKLKYGLAENVLNEPNLIVLSEKLANKIYGKTNVVGQVMQLDFGDEKMDLKVSGIMDNIPYNSHLQFDFLISGSTNTYWDDLDDPKRGGWPCHVYFKTKSVIEDSVLINKIDKEVLETYGDWVKCPIQNITDIYYNANNLFEHTKGGNILFIRILFIIGILIIFIVIINFSILSASKSLTRSKEIGIRRTLGSSRRKIGYRFISESVLFCLISGIVSIFISEFILNYFSRNFLHEADLTVLFNGNYIAFVILLSVFIGVVSGMYIARDALRKNVVEIIKGKVKAENEKLYSLRNVLIILQFVMTAALIAGNIIILKQLRFIENTDLGYQKEYTLNITKPISASEGQFEAYAENLKSETSIAGVGTMLYKLISDYNAGALNVIDENGDTASIRTQWNAIDYDLVPTLNMQILKGRNFSKEMGTDSLAVIINEAAANELNIEDPVGKRIVQSYFLGDNGKIIGVLKDFYFQSFDKKVHPMFFMLQKKDWKQEMVVRLRTKDIQQSILLLKKKWEETGINAPFEFTFIEDDFMGLVKKEKTLSRIALSFAFISIVLTMLGLIGLVRHTVEQRKREIGIRKVYGALGKNILILFNTHFIKLILIAYVFAIPLSYYLINQWLESFAYRTTIGTAEYIITALIIFPITFAVVTIQSRKAINMNPVDVIKDE